MKAARLNRRHFLAAALAAAPVAVGLDATWVEPHWLKVRRIRLREGDIRGRLAHITDIHYEGDRAYLEKVVRKLNDLSPDFVCFTGDLINDGRHLAEALEILGTIRSPLYGVPGNHDYWSKADFEPIAKAFAGTGGGWLMDQQALTRDGRFAITGLSSKSLKRPSLPLHPSARNICLMHFPAWADRLDRARFDLLLAGHSHGGQFRLPFYGAVSVPYGVERYEWGLYQTQAGPLYVGSGIGYFPIGIRFNCRPEIAVFEV